VAELIAAHVNYWIIVALMMIGLYVVFASANLMKRLIGLGVFQTSVFLFYISMGKVAGGRPPILPEGHEAEPAVGEAQALSTIEFSADALHATYSNPLPHVLILTAIVVGVATLAVGLALVVLIREAYGSIEDDDIDGAEQELAAGGGG
jgi:multicomponent Na+:H+ antiporter subunit C